MSVAVFVKLEFGTEEMLTLAFVRWLRANPKDRPQIIFTAIILIAIFHVFSLYFFSADFLALACWLIAKNSWNLCVFLVHAPARRQSQRQQAENARQLSEQRSQDEQHRNRRAEARSRCELFFSEHEVAISDRFSRASLDQYMSKYMSEKETPETVERRAIELQAVIENHCEAKGLMKRPRSIEELARWFLAEKERIEALPIDDRHRKTLVVQLKQRYSELSSELLSEMSP